MASATMETLRVNGLTTTQSLTVVQGFARSNITQEDLAEYPIPFTLMRVWDAYQTVLPGTSAADDLGLIGATFGTGVPSLETYDVKAAGAVTLYARFPFILPVEYQAGQDVQCRIRAGMVTTVADTTATVDLQAYLSDDFGLVSGADLVTTGATSINSLTEADVDFVITATSLSPGDVLDARVAVAVNDAATATVVMARIGRISRLCDIRG